MSVVKSFAVAEILISGQRPMKQFLIFVVVILATVGVRVAEPAAAPASQQPAVDQHGPNIKDTYKDHFLIGMAGDLPGNYSDQEMGLVKEDFNIVTPENCMKPGPIHPRENTWRFERPDALVKWCTDNNVGVHGHTLVWHAQTSNCNAVKHFLWPISPEIGGGLRAPAVWRPRPRCRRCVSRLENASQRCRNWFFRDGDKATVTQRLEDHISVLVGRYKGKIRSWDVVNEAIDDGGNAETAQTENLRNSSLIKHQDVMERVTFWGLSDGRTWRFGQHPLIFDSNNQRKPAYAAIVDTLLHPNPE
jgi:GH35 family endo-1,4-beta-xylanase